MPRRAAPVFPVRPNKSTTTVSALYRCVASPGRAVRPYKTRYYCNTGRLIESFPRRFLRRRALYACARQLQKAATPVSVPSGLSFFFHPTPPPPSPSFFSSIFFTRLYRAFVSCFRWRATIPVAIFDATDSRREVLQERGRKRKDLPRKSFRVKGRAIDVLACDSS